MSLSSTHVLHLPTPRSERTRVPRIPSTELGEPQTSQPESSIERLEHPEHTRLGVYSFGRKTSTTSASVLMPISPFSANTERGSGEIAEKRSPGSSPPRTLQLEFFCSNIAAEELRAKLPSSKKSPGCDDPSVSKLKGMFFLLVYIDRVPLNTVLKTGHFSDACFSRLLYI